MPQQQRLPKYKRPTEQLDLPAWRITQRDLDLLEVILRYRFCPASQLIRLAAGNARVTQRRLQRLWLRGLVSRFAFPTVPGVGEFNYYLDNREALDILSEVRQLDIHPQMLKELKNNREKNYAEAAMRGQHMQLGFLKHWLMISRMHYMLAMASKSSSGGTQLLDWHQDPELAGHKITLPRVSFNPISKKWRQHEDTERLPVEPDALFTLRFSDAAQGQQQAHFLYEADRGTMTATDMKQKMRALWWFIKNGEHKEAFGVHPIRAVLIETTTEARARALMEFTDHPLVSGNRRTSLFWFTVSPQFTGGDTNEKTAVTSLPHANEARYLGRPEIIFDQIWALGTRPAEYYTTPAQQREQPGAFPLRFSMHRLTDAENKKL